MPIEFLTYITQSQAVTELVQSLKLISKLAYYKMLTGFKACAYSVIGSPQWQWRERDKEQKNGHHPYTVYQLSDSST